MYQIFVLNQGFVDNASTLTEARKKVKQITNVSHQQLLKSHPDVKLVRTCVETSCAVKGESLYGYYISSFGKYSRLLFSCHIIF